MDYHPLCSNQRLSIGSTSRGYSRPGVPVLAQLIQYDYDNWCQITDSYQIIAASNLKLQEFST